MASTHRWSLRLAAEFGHADITPELTSFLSHSGVNSGVLTVQLVGSTGAITTIEYESGALTDLRRALDLLALLKTSVALPVVNGELVLGTWQQVVAINLDNRARDRELVAVLVG
jgi:thiamine phosphate synthase YjbQ (UPF0047 family)